MINNLLYPASPLLAKYIHCYHIMESTGADFKQVNQVVPNIMNEVNIYNNGTLRSAGQDIKITGNGNFAPLTLLRGCSPESSLVELEGSFSRITILFKPLGLNNFLPVSIGEVIGNETKQFNLWNTGSYSQVLATVFKGDNIRSRICVLEAFLKTIYQPIDQPQLLKATEYLSDLNQEKSIGEIAHLINMSFSDFNGLFKRYSGTSPVAYRKTAVFRQAVENKLFDEQSKKLTQVGYGGSFYDRFTPGTYTGNFGV